MAPKISDEVREERREAILRGAEASLREHGYAGTSTRTIAEAAGMTKGALYAYYPDRESILLALAEELTAGHLERLGPSEEVSAADQLRRLFGGYRRLAGDAERRATQRAVLDLWIFAGEAPTVRAVLRERYDRFVRTMTDLVRRCQAEGAVRRDLDPAHAGALILAAVDGMFFQSERLGVAVPMPGLVDALERMLFVDGPSDDGAGKGRTSEDGSRSAG